MVKVVCAIWNKWKVVLGLLSPLTTKYYRVGNTRMLNVKIHGMDQKKMHSNCNFVLMFGVW